MKPMRQWIPGASRPTSQTVRPPGGRLAAVWLAVWCGAQFAGQAGAVDQPATPDPVPGVVIAHSPRASGLYIGSPSLAILGQGDYVAAHDFFGPNSGEFQSARSRVYRSADRGKTWRQVSEIQGAFWSSLFVHRGALYLLGPDRHHGNVLIRRSLDGGSTWTSPTNRLTGLLREDGEYHCAPMPVIEHRGRLWRGLERRQPPVAWGINYRAGMLSVPVAADLLDAAQWTHAEFLPSDRAWNGGDMGAWLEGNAVVAPDGGMLDILRVQTKSPNEKAALVHISADGRKATFDPATGFVDFPGGAKKFAIRPDPESKLYWSLASIVAEPYRAENPGSIRNTLALTCSSNLVQWTVRCLLLHHPDAKRHGFQYVDWLFDGADLVAVCRTAYDDETGGAANFHDANFLTFHRFANFRRLTMADSVPVPHSGGAGQQPAEGAGPAGSPLKLRFVAAGDWGRQAGCYRGLDGQWAINEAIQTPHVDLVAREEQAGDAGKRQTADGSTGVVICPGKNQGHAMPPPGGLPNNNLAGNQKKHFPGFVARPPESPKT
jgi:hypothetical protein